MTGIVVVYLKLQKFLAVDFHLVHEMIRGFMEDPIRSFRQEMYLKQTLTYSRTRKPLMMKASK